MSQTNLNHDKLYKHFRYIERILKSKFEASKTFNHDGLKGKCREFFVEEFLTGHLSSNVGVSNCEIIDAFGNTSPEVDIAVYNKGIPRIAVSNKEKVLLAESVHIAIEIKSSLKSKSNIIECLKEVGKIKKIRKQQSYGFFQPTALEQEGRISLSDTIKCCIVVYESATLDLFKTTMSEYYDDADAIEDAVDFILLLDKGCLFKVDGLLHEPREGSSTNFTFKNDGEQLLYFFFYITRVLQRFSSLDYELREYIT